MLGVEYDLHKIYFFFCRDTQMILVIVWSKISFVINLLAVHQLIDIHNEYTYNVKRKIHKNMHIYIIQNPSKITT